MSAIGDYIHLTYEGYIMGPTLGSGNPPFFGGGSRREGNWQSSHRNKERQYKNKKNKMRSNVTKQLEKQTNNVLKNLQQMQLAKTAQTADMITNAVLEDLHADLLDSVYKNLNWDSLVKMGALNSQYMISPSSFQVTKERTPEQAQKQLEQSFNILYNGIHNHLSEFLKYNENFVNIKEVKHSLNKTKDTFTNFLNQVKVEQNYADFKNSHYLKQTLNNLLGDLQKAIDLDANLAQHFPIQDIINNIMQGAVKGVAANRYKGDIAEMLLKEVALHLDNHIDTQVKEALVVGGQSSQRGLQKSYFEGVPIDIVMDGEPAKNEKEFEKNFGQDFIVKGSSAQEKIDVSISMLDNARSVRASVKNYKTNPTIKNASASLLSLIQNENDYDFVNHFLNLNAIKDIRRTHLSSRNEANDLMKKFCIMKLITGYNTIVGQGQVMEAANAFVVFDSDKYKVKIYNMQEVLNKLEQNRMNGLSLPKDLYKYNIADKNDRTGAHRRAMILHQMNIKTEFSFRSKDLQ